MAASAKPPAHLPQSPVPSPQPRRELVRVISADFVTSAAAGGTAEGIPRDGLPQIAMAGRSNVGKSTLINALGRQKIARTSAAPGKTRLANIYRLTLDVGPGRRGLYLIDLPGYGYARGGADAAAELRAVAEAYFTSATVGVRSPRGASTADTAPGGLVAALLLVDARHPGLESDRLAARWLASMDVDYRVVATKVDKLSRSERARNLRTLETEFDMPPLPIAATSGEGLDELWKMIASLVRVGRG